MTSTHNLQRRTCIQSETPVGIQCVVEAATTPAVCEQNGLEQLQCNDDRVQSRAYSVIHHYIVIIMFGCAPKNKMKCPQLLQFVT